jgi:hypothetical protein
MRSPRCLAFAETIQCEGAICLTASSQPRIMIRGNSDGYHKEEALVPHPTLGTACIQNGKQVASLGVNEHWDSDLSCQYTRNKDPKNGNGIELIYLPANERRSSKQVMKNESIGLASCVMRHGLRRSCTNA